MPEPFVGGRPFVTVKQFVVCVKNSVRCLCIRTKCNRKERNKALLLRRWTILFFQLRSQSCRKLKISHNIPFLRDYFFSKSIFHWILLDFWFPHLPGSILISSVLIMFGIGFLRKIPHRNVERRRPSLKRSAASTGSGLIRNYRIQSGKSGERVRSFAFPASAVL